MRQRLELIVQCDYRRPTEIVEVVTHLRTRLRSTEWAMLEALALEVLRQAAVDPVTLEAVVSMVMEARRKAGLVVPLRL